MLPNLSHARYREHACRALRHTHMQMHKENRAKISVKLRKGSSMHASLIGTEPCTPCRRVRRLMLPCLRYARYIQFVCRALKHTAQEMIKQTTATTMMLALRWLRDNSIKQA